MCAARFLGQQMSTAPFASGLKCLGVIDTFRKIRKCFTILPERGITPLDERKTPIVFRYHAVKKYFSYLNNSDHETNLNTGQT